MTTTADRREKGSGGITRLANGKYRAFVETTPDPGDGSRRRVSATGRTKSEALRKARDKALRPDMGMTPGGNATVAEWMDHWVDEVIEPRRAPNTTKSYRARIRMDITPVIGAVPLDRLRPSHVRMVENRILRGDGRTGTDPRSAATARLTHSILKTALGDAMAEGLIDRNPAALTEVPETEPVEIAILTTGQAARLQRGAAAGERLQHEPVRRRDQTHQPAHQFQRFHRRMADPVHGRPLPRSRLRTIPEHGIEAGCAAGIIVFRTRMGHAPAVTGFRACAWSAFSTDGDAGLSVEFLGRGSVEQHVRRETGFGRVVGAIRFVRAVDVVAARAGVEVGMPVLVLRLLLIRRVAEWDAACVDMQRARPVSEQIVGECPVQRLACEADGFVRGLQLAVPAGPLFALFGGERTFCTLLSFTLEWYAGFAFEECDMGRFHPTAMTLMLTPALVFRLIMIAMRDPAGSVFWTATLALTGLIAWQAYTVWTDQFR